MAEHQVLNAVSSVDKARIDDLAAVAGTRILDTTATQLDSLRELLPMPQADVLDEDPRWIHYPWRGALVRVLGPLGYRRLRLDRNRNKITADEQARMADLTVGVVGLSVGHAVAHTLAASSAWRISTNSTCPTSTVSRPRCSISVSTSRSSQRAASPRWIPTCPS